MTWKDKKALENKKVTALGGKVRFFCSNRNLFFSVKILCGSVLEIFFCCLLKPQKMHRLPLSVARVQMKKQKDREEKMLEQVIF